MKTMQVNKKMQAIHAGLKFGLFVSAVFFYSSVAAAQECIDSAASGTYSGAVKTAELRYCIKESNVVFPEILQGEEDKSLDYIEKFSSRRKEYLHRMYNKGKKLLPKAVAIFKKYDLPQELKVLMPLESAYNANAVSSAGAVGYWQFMDAVAREYGLKYAVHLTPSEKKKIIKEKGKKANAYLKTLARQKDDRKNFMKSTIAAARYLRDRRLNLDDNWLLVVASYNCGVGNVWNAMERTGKSSPSFWDIKKYLPAETQAYVMNFITLNVIFHNYDNFAKNKLVFTPVKVSTPGDVEEKIAEAMAEPTASRLQ
jgi:hypothetical protein